MKFNVGDKVKVIGNNMGGNYLLGEVGVVSEDQSNLPPWGDYRVELDVDEFLPVFIFKESQLELVSSDEFEWKINPLNGSVPQDIMEKFAEVAQDTGAELVTVTVGVGISRVEKTKIPKVVKGDLVMLTGVHEGVRAVVNGTDSILDEYDEVEIEMLDRVLYPDGSVYIDIGDTLPYKVKYLEKI